MQRFTYFLFLFWGLALPGSVHAQYVPEHVSNEALYDFLDELASEHFISLVSVVRPYSRTLIAEKLEEAQRSQQQMNARQRFLLNLYRDDLQVRNMAPDRGGSFRRAMNNSSLFPPKYDYTDGAVQVSAKPILGSHYHTNDNNSIFHFHGGGSIHAFASGGWSAWASLRTVVQTNEALARPGLLTQNEGGIWSHEADPEPGQNNFRENDMRGGIAYSWGWGSIAFQQNHLVWGDNYNGANIIAMQPNTPSFPMLSMHLTSGDRFTFSYHHGWLNSMEVDTLRTIEFPAPHPPRIDYYNKYFAANIFTFKPMDRLHISAGNSIVYSANNMYIGYFIPIMIFRALEPTQAESPGALNNPAAFINISSRQIRHLHLYASWFANAFKFERIVDSERLNYTSTKAGFRLTNWPVSNTSFTLEYTFTNPKTYDHRTPIITYEHKWFNMGHYLGPNATDLYAAVTVKPWRGLTVTASYADARKGNIYPHAYAGQQDRDPFMKDMVWRNTAYTLEASYAFYNNIGMYARVRLMDLQTFDDPDGEGGTAYDILHSLSPAFHHGETTTISFGLYINR